MIVPVVVVTRAFGGCRLFVPGVVVRLLARALPVVEVTLERVAAVVVRFAGLAHVFGVVTRGQEEEHAQGAHGHDYACRRDATVAALCRSATPRRRRRGVDEKKTTHARSSWYAKRTHGWVIASSRSRAR